MIWHSESVAEEIQNNPLPQAVAPVCIPLQLLVNPELRMRGNPDTRNASAV